jgi:hypothetical protein
MRGKSEEDDLASPKTAKKKTKKTAA